AVILRDRERQAGVQSPDAIRLPAAKNLMRHTAVKSGWRGQLVQPANYGIVSHVEGIHGFVRRAIAGILVRTVAGETETLVAAIAFTLRLPVGVSEARLQTMTKVLLITDLQAVIPGISTGVEPTD